ncbi:NAD(P)/FAD-dependent oxidoreductase [Halobacillus litoralis]|uniref:NAD(P)/FAD-dependent oxidoreductase n=1 Tax=Halobacillus litoralis TaxID=45668 RepID=UPI001CD33188|nr:NAD(P)/FAD-dependent oxidoreductase [Halobacillus litoralis]MCA1022853.1 NAD(P)/FAD-dependent oxidoreductase [Halobacillus litoralis]
MTYHCIIIGGGPAGLQAAIQLGRYMRSVLIIDAGEGRSSACRKYSNLLGFPEGVSGETLRRRGLKQVEDLGVERVEEVVAHVHKSFTDFIVQTQTDRVYTGKSLLFATGIRDAFPDVPGLKECLGISVYLCPDCDGYEVKNRRTAVWGQGDPGAAMAEIIHYWTRDIVYINHDAFPLSGEKRAGLDNKKIPVYEAVVTHLTHHGGNLQSLHGSNGEAWSVEKTFLAFGGSRPQTGLADSLGVIQDEKGHVHVDPRTKMTNIDGVWAAGDILMHSQLVSTAAADGAQAAVWIHKWLHRQSF